MSLRTFNGLITFSHIDPEYRLTVRTDDFGAYMGFKCIKAHGDTDPMANAKNMIGVHAIPATEALKKLTPVYELHVGDGDTLCLVVYAGDAVKNFATYDWKEILRKELFHLLDTREIKDRDNRVWEMQSFDYTGSL